MVNVNIDQIDSQSFTDAKLLEMEVDLESKSATLFLRGGWIFVDNTIVDMKDVRIIISDWKNLNILIEEIDVIEFKLKNPLVSEILDTICEFQCNSEVILRGYGKGREGCWTEWIFSNPRVMVFGTPYVLLNNGLR